MNFIWTPSVMGKVKKRICEGAIIQMKQKGAEVRY